MGKSDKEKEYLTFVEDRAFNDLRYTINSGSLIELGWKEQMSWEEGLQATLDWYRKYGHRYENIESVLVAHPRQGGSTENEI